MNRRRLTALLLAVTVSLAAAAAIGAPAAVTAHQSPAPVQSYWPGQEELALAGERIYLEGPSRWPDLYAGVATDAPAGTLIVQRVPAPGIDAQIRALAAPARVRLVDAIHPARVVDGWADQLRNDTAWWQRRGVTIHGILTRPGECAVAEVDNPRRDARRLTDHYRGMALCVDQGYPAEPLAAG